MSKMTPYARSNAPWGWKALVVYPDGRTQIPVRRNFATRAEAISFAQRHIASVERASRLFQQRRIDARVRSEQRIADRIDGYDRDDLGESPDY